MSTVPDMAAMLGRLGTIAALSPEKMGISARPLAQEVLGIADAILEVWVLAHGGAPTRTSKEGFRLLALHAQGARGEPSFNACRETCREIVYQHNVVQAADGTDGVRALRLMVMVARHLALFVSGKLEVQGLGDFCCASRPLRAPADLQPNPGA